MKNRNVGFAVLSAAAAIALLSGTSRMSAKSVGTAAAVSNAHQEQGQPGQAQPGQPGEAQPGQPGEAQPGQSQSAQKFTGTIQKSSDGTYELSANGTTYQLSDQSQAAKFEGKQVTVTGALDSSSNTIQVQQIEAASGSDSGSGGQ